MKNLTKLIALLVVLALLLGTLWAITNRSKTEETKLTQTLNKPFFPDLKSDKVYRIDISEMNVQGKQPLIFRKNAGVWEVAVGRDIMADIVEKQMKEESQQSTTGQESVNGSDVIKPQSETKNLQTPGTQEAETPTDPRKDVGPAGDAYRAFVKADPEKVQAMIDAIVNLKHGTLITKDATKQKDFKVTNSMLGTEVSFYDDQMNKIADIIIGDAGADFQSTYVRLPDSDEVYMVSTSLKMMFETQLMAVRDKAIFKNAPETFMSVKVNDIGQNRQVSLGRVEGIWQATDGLGNKIEADAKKVDDFLSALGNLSANSFVDPNMPSPTPPASDTTYNPADPYGFLTPILEISFTTSDNVSHSLTVGRSEGTTFFAVVDGRTDDVVKISSSTIATIRPSAESLKGGVQAEQISGVQPESGPMKDQKMNVTPVPPAPPSGN